MRSPFEVTLAGLAATRIAWITAIVVCALAILSGLLSGSGGGNSSNWLPGFAFSDGGNSSQFPDFTDIASFDPAAALVGGDAQEKAPQLPKTETAGPQGTAGSEGNRGQWGNQQAPGDSRSRAGGPHPESQPGGGGGRAPSSTPGPNRPQQAPQAPTVTVNVPKPPQAPSVSVTVPKPPPSSPPPSSSGTSAPSLPQAPQVQVPQVSVNVSAPVQTPIVNVPDVSVNLP